VIPGHRSEIRVPTGVQGNEGDKLDFRVWPEENGLLGSYAFNNISVISWWSILLMEETGVPGENLWPTASYWN